MISNNSAALITGGLGLPANCGLIVSQFHVFSCEIIVTIPPVDIGVSVGGSKPLLPGEIANFYKPVEIQYDKPIVLQHDKEVPFIDSTSNNYVRIELVFNDKTYDKEFLTNTRTAKVITSVTNLINVTRGKVKVTLSKFKRIAVNAKVSIRNLWRKP